MDERLRFVARLLDGETMAALCEEFGISRKTGYKIFQRYQDIGVHGLTRSQSSAASARQSAADGGREGDRPAEEGVSDAGARRRSASGSGSAGRRWRCPAISTVHAVLDRHGLVDARAPAAAAAPAPARRCRGRARPIALWCADYKGEFLLGNQRYCYPLTITDFASRGICSRVKRSRRRKERYAFTRLRAGLSGVWPARGDSHRQRRAVRVGARALRPQQTRGVVAAPRHSARAHRARAIPSRMAGTSACI